jgi:hypothetical protein
MDHPAMRVNGLGLRDEDAVLGAAAGRAVGSWKVSSWLLLVSSAVPGLHVPYTPGLGPYTSKQNPSS